MDFDFEYNVYANGNDRLERLIVVGGIKQSHYPTDRELRFIRGPGSSRLPERNIWEIPWDELTFAEKQYIRNIEISLSIRT